jgi:hypothetical protein
MATSALVIGEDGDSWRALLHEALLHEAQQGAHLLRLEKINARRSGQVDGCDTFRRAHSPLR